jgi:uncharacterized protein
VSGSAPSGHVKKIIITASVVLAFFLALDACRAPQNQISAKIVLSAIGGYQRHFSSRVPSHCRFTPTCSEYARLAVIKYGTLKGVGLAAWRVVRCSPLTKNPGQDWP